MKITAVSDLHGDMPKLGGGDLLIIAGDLTARDTMKQYLDFRHWLSLQPYEKKIVVAGNHDMLVQKDRFWFDEFLIGATYLQDEGIELEYEVEVEEDHKFKGPISYKQKKTLKIWGTPWTQWFHGVNPDCAAFMLRSEFQLKDKFDLIPDDTDILVTHGPAFRVLDYTTWDDRAGSKALSERIYQLRNKKLKYHIHGHIHEGYGKFEEEGFTALNVARMDVRYVPKNEIVNIEI